jgi:hypothetical protein
MPDMIYKGGSFKLNNDLSNFLAEKMGVQFDDTAYIFIIQVSANKKVNGINDKIKFEVFGKDNSMKKLVSDFLTSNSINWDYRKFKNSNVIIPLFITSFHTDYKHLYFDWSDVLNKELPKSQMALFFRPLVIQLYCCPSEPGRDF